MEALHIVLLISDFKQFFSSFFSYFWHLEAEVLKYATSLLFFFFKWKQMLAHQKLIAFSLSLEITKKNILYFSLLNHKPRALLKILFTEVLGSVI